MSNIIDGKFVASQIKQQIKEEIVKMGVVPTLAVILVGEDAASQVYVHNKHKACSEVGINSLQITLPTETTEEELLQKIQELNGDDSVHGILVQLPLPKHINKDHVINTINPLKDVDGFTKGSRFTPCTPAGVIELLECIPDYKFAGKTALVIGRSDIVGKPVAKLLLDRNCTVIQTHSKTPKDVLCRMFSFADIVISAVGKRDVLNEFDEYQYFKDNRHDFYGDFSNNRDRVIIDVGINRDENDKLCGDFNEKFKKRLSEYYTTVPGGVGPMTIAMLLKNTVEATKN